MGQDRLNLLTFIESALRLEDATIKRLGWLLSHIGVKEKQLSQLAKRFIKGFRKLDANGEDFGPYNKKWMVRENI